MTPEATRNAVIDAVRRDLLGPLADAAGTYPGATAVKIGPGHVIDRPRDLSRLFVAADGEEVLLAFPTSQYIVGALYPALRPDEEHVLDAEQAPTLPTREDAGDDIADMAPGPAEPLADDSASDSTEDNAATEDGPEDRPGRPSSFGMSFVLRDDTRSLMLRVTGARYEPFPYTFKGAQRTGWHRRPLDSRVAVALGAEGARARVHEAVVFEPLHLEVGVHARAAVDDQRIITCYLVNRTPSNGAQLAERVLFGAELAVQVPEGQLADYPARDTDTTAEAASLRLLYAGSPVRAVGHGVDAIVTKAPGLDVVRTEALPVSAVTGTTPNIADEHGPLAVDMDALGRWEPDAIATVERMIRSYRTWISDLHRKAAQLTGAAGTTAEAHVRRCEEFADDIEAGWELAASGPVHECLRWTSAAMAQQRRSYATATRSVSVDNGQVRVAGPEPASTGQALWRPFQLAFLLANLPPVTYPQHPRRGEVDVIWMPTGGGKTEAYLALAAFTMLHRRRTEPTAGGTAVLLRYTLRLLTAQQLQRAASLLCALESLRVTNREIFGRERFSIGAWLGRASTPNWRRDALRDLRRLANKNRGAKRPFLLSRCPACAAALGDVVNGQVLGYGLQATPTGQRMQASCPNPVCTFHLSRTPQGLPVYEVDEDIYEKPPTFLVATVDKFAQLAWNDRARALFGIDRAGARIRPSPDLIIQDELHLISVVLLNPLTSRDISHYERFTSVHERLYVAVEPASVTPFTDAALTRGLRGTLAAIVRQLRPQGVEPVQLDDVPMVHAAAAGVRRRAEKFVGAEVSARIEALASAVAAEVETAADEQLAWGVAGRSGVQFLRPLEDPAPVETASWAVLTSLRSVDADAALRIDENWLPAHTRARADAPAPPMAAQDNVDEDAQETW